MKVNLTKDEIEYLLRCIDLGETFVSTHQWAYDKGWKQLDVDKDKLIERLKKLQKNNIYKAGYGEKPETPRPKIKSRPKPYE